MKRVVHKLATALAVAVFAFPSAAAAQGNPIDDILKLAMDAFNDLKYPTADSVARRVMAMSSATSAQRARAQMVMAAAAFPDDPAAQKRTIAYATLKTLLKTNYDAKMPQELSWPGLDSLVEEVRRTVFGVAVSGEAVQTAIGVDGTAKLHFKANKPGLFRMTITSKAGNAVVLRDSLIGTAEGDITFKTMRDEKPVFTSGDYAVSVVAYEPGAKGDTATSNYTMKVDAPALTFLTVPTKMDSTKLLKERTGKSGAKSIIPALFVGGAAYALAAVLHGEGGLANGVADSKGMGVAGGMALVTIVAGFADRGRVITANVAANQAAGIAFQKSITDAQTENRRRITEYKTVITIELGSR